MSKKRDLRWLFAVPAVPALIALGGAMVCVGLCVGVPCMSTGLRYGLWLDTCPTSDLRIGGEVNAYGLVRSAESTIYVRPIVRFLEGEGQWAYLREETAWRGTKVEIALLDADNKPVDGMLDIKKRQRAADDSGRVEFTVKLGAVPDGDYVLRATIEGPETVVVDTPVAIYAPALAHLMTDWPLYKPGQDVLLRSVLFRRTDLTPLEGRPGKWHVFDPSGTEMLVERDKAGAYGVADTSFPLDTHAAVGAWRATWESGAATDAVTFDVRPFRLPRFTVEAEASDTWYRIGDELLVEGRAKYSSGAPVAKAPVHMSIGVAEGRWPMPLEWEDGFDTTTDAYGKFRIPIGRVPPDLLERAVLGTTVSVTEAAGETATGGARLVLSQYDLQVQAVTELGDGLVGGFNNRAYLRITSPDGRPVRNADVKVSPWWDEASKPYDAKSDVDGVASVQLDPGDPVTVIIEAPPYRPRPLEPAQPSVSNGQELATGSSLDMAERRALERVLGDVAACGDYAVGGTYVSLAARVDGNGSVRRVMTGSTLAEQCVADAMRRVSFPDGDERTYQVSWYVPDSLRPSLSGNPTAAYGSTSDIATPFFNAALEARRCMPRNSGISGSQVVTLHWAIVRGSRSPDVTLVSESSAGLSSAALGCIAQQFRQAGLDAPAEADAMGTGIWYLQVPSSSTSIPQDTAITGYQLRIAALADGTKIGEAPLVLNVGNVPSLRIRATPTLAKPGEEVEIEMLRGPGWYGDLPQELHLREGTVDVVKFKIDKDTHKGKVQIPADRDGFMYVEYSGTRAVIWVEPRAKLEVALSTDRPKYRPGETATLLVSTTDGGRPTQAGVGLVGVDSTLAQLAPLLGPDEYGRITVRETSDQPAFGAFDPKALVLGQVTGENAAKAAVLRITNLPMDPAGDDSLYVSGRSVHDDTEVLTLSFYRALDRLVSKVADWEGTAPAGEVMTNQKMAELWKETLADLKKEGKPAKDAFGRELSIDVLPADLLAQVNPRSVVEDSTRLPEDITDWNQYVDAELRQ